MFAIPSWIIMIVLVVCLAWALWLFRHVREDAHLAVSQCEFDDPKERLKELEAAFAAGMMTDEEFQRLAERLGEKNVEVKVSGISSRTLPKTWDDLPTPPDRSQNSDN